MSYRSNIVTGAIGYADVTIKQNKAGSFTLLVTNATGTNINMATYSNAVLTAWTTSKNTNTLFTFDKNTTNFSNIGLFDGRIVVNFAPAITNVSPRAYSFDLDVTSDGTNYSGFVTGSLDIQAGR